ncbi:hypothetical protein [Amycolatopsis sp. BJA-103]|uniref:hypothetical protein n=1 Tax=Amycolatopsis sp. BJA-103 TaxID=1911175 RepID=UPI0011AF027F|nr:hypothetical protein [Amycolatopsis sp. BJA-103]
MMIVVNWWRKGKKSGKTLKLVRRARLVPAVPGDALLSASVDFDGELIALWAAKADVDAVAGRVTGPGGAIFPTTRPSRPVPARATRHAPDTRLVAEIAELAVANPSAHAMPGGRILIVGARAEWRPEGADRNAVLYEPDGTIVARSTFGDGIEHVMPSRAGNIWVGYFDEGVMGNFGWGTIDDGPTPLGDAGLVRYAPDLSPDWWFPYEGETWDSIDDCYALNVDEETAWLCYYGEFPLARVENGVVTVWDNEISGARALAVSGGHVAFCGGYSPERDRLVMTRLEDGRVRIIDEHRIALPGGKPLPQRYRMIGRGPVLHLVTDDAWYRLNITHLL